VDSPAAALAATGERTVPGMPDEDYWFARHEVAYRWVADLLGTDRVVVDAGAGEGYGTSLLAPSLARPVITLEYDATACRHMRNTYPDARVVMANLDTLPLRTGSVDVIVSFQVIEHLWDLSGFLRECRRALSPGGQLIVTTPNRLTFSPGLARGTKPMNPFHVEEFDAQQVTMMMDSAGFDRVDLRGVHHAARLRAWEHRHGSIVAAQITAAVQGTWPPALRRMVSTVTARDFTIDDASLANTDPVIMGAQDLLVIAGVVP
jgi:SAM-dependent methyltransferase